VHIVQGFRNCVVVRRSETHHGMAPDQNSACISRKNAQTKNQRSFGRSDLRLRKSLLTISFELAIGTFGAPATSATSTTGTVAVTATTSGSISMTFVTDGAGITLGNSGTSAATIAFGTVQAYGGTVPSGVTKTVNAPTNWSLSTPFDVEVDLANQTSSNYTLTAALQSSDATNTWQLGSSTLSTTPATLTATGAYGSAAYTLTLTIPFSAAGGAISNTINFTATAN
jgi:hypothetical protein